MYYYLTISLIDAILQIGLPLVSRHAGYQICNRISTKGGENMDYFSMTDKGILQELGSRIKDKRLSSNIAQSDLAAKAGVSINVVQNIEYGKPSTILGFLRVMRALKVLNQLDLFLPKVPFRPSEIVKLEGKRRKRASRVARPQGT